jgi:hypothetical protein
MTERKCAHGGLSRWTEHERTAVKQNLTVSATRRVALLLKGAHTVADAVDLCQEKKGQGGIRTVNTYITTHALEKKRKAKVGFEPWTLT